MTSVSSAAEEAAAAVVDDAAEIYHDASHGHGGSDWAVPVAIA